MLRILDQYSNILSNSLLLFLISLRSILHSEQFLKILFRYPHFQQLNLLKKYHVRIHPSMVLFPAALHFLVLLRSVLLYILFRILERFLLDFLLLSDPRENKSCCCHLHSEMLDVHSQFLCRSFQLRHHFHTSLRHFFLPALLRHLPTSACPLIQNILELCYMDSFVHRWMFVRSF